MRQIDKRRRSNFRKKYKKETKGNFRKLSKAVPGFTILETLIVLLLTSLVVSLSFAYFSAFQKYMRQNIRTTDYEVNVLRFESLLTYDFDRCEKIYPQNNELILEKNGEEIIYIFQDDRLIREHAGNTDTLIMQSVDFDMIYSEKHPTLLTGLQINLLDINHEPRTFYLRKEYPVKIRYFDFYKKNFSNE